MGLNSEETIDSSKLTKELKTTSESELAEVEVTGVLTVNVGNVGEGIAKDDEFAE